MRFRRVPGQIAKTFPDLPSCWGYRMSLFFKWQNKPPTRVHLHTIFRERYSESSTSVGRQHQKTSPTALAAMVGGYQFMLPGLPEVSFSFRMALFLVENYLPVAEKTSRRQDSSKKWSISGVTTTSCLRQCCCFSWGLS